MKDSRSAMGSVKQLPSGRWRARVTVGVTVEGKRRTASATLDTEREAREWATLKAVEMGGRPDLGRGMTLSMLWPLYRVGKQVTKKTMSAYAWHMDKLWLPLLGDTDVTTISPATVQRAIDPLTREKAKHAKNALGSVLTWACQNGYIGSNPLHGHRFTYPKERPADFDLDPFGAIERSRDVWDIRTALRCFNLIRALPLEPAWLACVGAGLRVEEALAVRRADVRRIEVGGHLVTQVAVHAARTAYDGLKQTKTPQSVRIVGMLEPFGKRYWEIAEGIDDRSKLMCAVSASNQNKRWRGYFEPPSTSKHAPRKEGWNNLGRLHELPYLPLSKMRNTHVTIMAEAGVSDSINALMHGHTEMVERKHYLNPDLTMAVVDASGRIMGR